MRIIRAELHLVRLPLRRPFTTSSHTKSHLDHILVRCVDADGVEAWGECASPSDPYYCAETVETCWHILREFLVPALLGREWSSPEQATTTWALVRGNAFAKAGLDIACWDLFARREARSVASVLGGTLGRIRSGVSLGIEPTPDRLVAEVERFVAEGYERIKLKIAPGRDVEFVDAVRRRLPEVPLTVDANAAYRWDDSGHRAALADLDGMGLAMIEQPLSEDDIVDHARLQATLRTPICLDESIRSASDARKAIELGSCRIVNIKVSRLGGLTEARRTHDECRSRGIPVWCGGMHEFGIGRAANIALSSLPGFTLPGDVSGSDRAYLEDVVDPPIRAERGALSVPFERPGLGFEPDGERIAAHRIRFWESTAAD